MAARHRGAKSSSAVLVKPKPGGEAPIAIPGVAVMHQSKESSKGFKKGGKVSDMAECKKDGGVAEGDTTSSGRMDKTPRKARGGAATMRGRSPMSAAYSTSMPKGGTTH